MRRRNTEAALREALEPIRAARMGPPEPDPDMGTLARGAEHAHSPPPDRRGAAARHRLLARERERLQERVEARIVTVRPVGLATPGHPVAASVVHEAGGLEVRRSAAPVHGHPDLHSSHEEAPEVAGRAVVRLADAVEITPQRAADVPARSFWTVTDTSGSAWRVSSPGDPVGGTARVHRPAVGNAKRVAEARRRQGLRGPSGGHARMPVRARSERQRHRHERPHAPAVSIDHLGEPQPAAIQPPRVYAGPGAPAGSGDVSLSPASDTPPQSVATRLAASPSV